MSENSELFEAKRILNEIINATNYLRDFNQLLSLLEEDDDFVTFVNGTMIGNNLYIELNELIKIVSVDIVGELNSLYEYTYNYLNSRLVYETE